MVKKSLMGRNYKQLNEAMKCVKKEERIKETLYRTRPQTEIRNPESNAKLEGLYLGQSTLLWIDGSYDEAHLINCTREIGEILELPCSLRYVVPLVLTRGWSDGMCQSDAH
ncbi:hypothetical protein FBUS_00474 [Fasciolopsis buskii]|uniref:Uncharacterized protein n=1 Tax=Fasciolopsis buskii TaxID=27845 RepID=A0A8E0RNW8_9TREM|nr:hypothetical protein FBUS_00474 [Fasciolopsis buski]